MNKDLLDLLACPECGSADLVLESFSDNFPVTQGRLSCSSCATQYSILKGIPQMVPSPLGATLQLRNAYLERLRASMLQERGEIPEPSNLEI
ncbi:MAG: Trm112 family protein, partial [Dehalococcoidia bacterium]